MNGNDKIVKLVRRQNIWRMGFVFFIIFFVYAQSYQGRVFIHRAEVRGCQRAQIAYHKLNFSQLFVDCSKAYPSPSPFPW